MKLSKVKIVTLAAIVSTQLFGGVLYASHELGNQPAVPETTDGHISWHEFRHELSGFALVSATMNHGGVITLSGHTDDRVEKQIVEKLASKVRGATDVRSTITTD